MSYLVGRSCADATNISESFSAAAAPCHDPIPFSLVEENVEAARRPRTDVEIHRARILGILRPGDCPVYWTPCLADIVIGIKTWSRRAAHIEVYEGRALIDDARSLPGLKNVRFASRGDVAPKLPDEAGIHVSSAARADGVNYYPFRLEGLQYIRRPLILPRWEESRQYFEQHCRGCKYAWESLLSFAVAHVIRSRRRMFCSDYATRRYRAAGCVPYDIDYASQLVPPDYYLVTPAFWTAYDSQNHQRQKML